MKATHKRKLCSYIHKAKNANSTAADCDVKISLLFPPHSLPQFLWFLCWLIHICFILTAVLSVHLCDEGEGVWGNNVLMPCHIHLTTSLDSCCYGLEEDFFLFFCYGLCKNLVCGIKSTCRDILFYIQFYSHVCWMCYVVSLGKDGNSIWHFLNEFELFFFFWVEQKKIKPFLSHIGTENKKKRI